MVSSKKIYHSIEEPQKSYYRLTKYVPSAFIPYMVDFAEIPINSRGYCSLCFQINFIKYLEQKLGKDKIKDMQRLMKKTAWTLSQQISWRFGVWKRMTISPLSEIFEKLKSFLRDIQLSGVNETIKQEIINSYEPNVEDIKSIATGFLWPSKSSD